MVIPENTMSNAEYHIHVNHFGASRPNAAEGLQQIGLRSKPCIILGPHPEASPAKTETLRSMYNTCLDDDPTSLGLVQGSPANHPNFWMMHFKAGDISKVHAVYERALKAMRRDSSFRGYIEAEAVSQANQIEYAARPYNPKFGVPCPKMKWWVCGAKTADIHIFRGREAPYDTLDTRLEEKGFYEVWTAKERIWTLVVDDSTHGKKTFLKMADYFENAGGIKAMEYETITHLTTVPHDFPLITSMRRSKEK